MNADGTQPDPAHRPRPRTRRGHQPDLVAGRDADPLPRLDRRGVQRRPRRHQCRMAAAARPSRSATVSAARLAADPPSYPRPKGATPLTPVARARRAALHRGQPHARAAARVRLVRPAAARPRPYLTVGTPDANGQPAASTGSLRAEVIVGSPGPTDEADVRLDASRSPTCALASDLSDYAGEVSAQFAVRRTDKESQPFNSTPGTMVDRIFSFDATCAPTAGPEGATCSRPDERRRAPAQHRPGGQARDLGAGPGPRVRRRRGRRHLHERQHRSSPWAESSFPNQAPAQGRAPHSANVL